MILLYQSFQCPILGCGDDDFLVGVGEIRVQFIRSSLAWLLGVILLTFSEKVQILAQ